MDQRTARKWLRRANEQIAMARQDVKIGADEVEFRESLNDAIGALTEILAALDNGESVGRVAGREARNV